MGYSDLLERMMHRDTDAFLEMTDQYGWALYSEIRKKCPNKADADRIYDETMQQFYRYLQNPASEDPLEALLCAFADHISKKWPVPAGQAGTCEPLDGIQPPPVQFQPEITREQSKAGKPRGRFWFRFGMFLVMAGFAAVIWISLGLMMEAGILPYYDLGYTWFSAIAGRWL